MNRKVLENVGVMVVDLSSNMLERTPTFQAGYRQICGGCYRISGPFGTVAQTDSRQRLRLLKHTDPVVVELRCRLLKVRGKADKAVTHKAIVLPCSGEL